MSQAHYGIPFPFPPDIDYYNLNNVDIGFTADLTSSQESYSFYLPLPGSIDIFEQTIVVHALEFFTQAQHFASDDQNGLLAAFLSTRGEVPAAGQTLTRTAADDEFWKAQFMRNIIFGVQWYQPTDTSLAGPMQWNMDAVVDAFVTLPLPLDQFSRPLHIHLFKQDATIDPATQDETPVTFNGQTGMDMVVWFTVRDLTNEEKDRSARNASDRFAFRDA